MHHADEIQIKDDLVDRRISCTSILMVLQWCCHCLFFLIGILLWVITLSAWNDISDQDKFIVDYTKNWEYKPIVDIKPTTSLKWPEGYENLLTREFSTLVGWYCYDDVQNKSSLYTGNCNINQTAKGCTRVSPVGPVVLNKFYSNQLCGLREGLNFLETQRPNKSNDTISCPKNKKLWGSNDINTSFWVGLTHSWPISELFIVSKNTPTPKGYKQHDIDYNNKVVYTDTYNGMPIVRLQLTEGKVWFNSDHFQTTPGRISYKLLAEKYCLQRLHTPFTDPRYRLIGHVREDKLFKDNFIYDDMVSLPLFDVRDTTEYEWNLYSNSYYYWSHHWDTNEETNRLRWYSVLQNMAHVHNINDYILATSIFYALGVWIILMYFFGYFTVIWITSRQEINTAIRNIFLVFGYPLRIVFLSFLIYFSSQCIRYINDYQNTIISVTVAEWAPEFTTQAFFAYEQPLQPIFQLSYTIIILSILSLVIIGFDLILELSARGIPKSAYGKFYAEFAD